MVVANMDSPTRDQVLKLMEEKDRIESELQELNLVLETNNVGLDEPLVDQDGFPRNDVDVYRVRHARHRIICLQNDHTAIMKQIEKAIHLLHARVLGTPEGVNGYTNESSSMDTSPPTIGSDIYSSRNQDEGIAIVTASTHSLTVEDINPFVKVNFVSEGSPAEHAGICVNDEILQFGSINAANFRALTQIGELVQHSVGRQVNIKIRRNSETMNVTLVPTTWAGRGLLGCNIIPI